MHSPPQTKPAEPAAGACPPRPSGNSAEPLQALLDRSPHVARLEAHAQALNGDAVQRIGQSSRAVAQMRKIDGLASLKEGLVPKLDAGEKQAGSDRKLLSSRAGNLDKLTHLYTPADLMDRELQESRLKPGANDWLEGWYDRVDARVQRGAEQTIGDILFWAGRMREALECEDVEPMTVDLLGDELHDRGLGPAKVGFDVEFNHNPLVVFRQTYVVKPEDRSVEKAILGSSGSVAAALNSRVASSRRVATLGMETDQQHGTIAEYVSTSLAGVAEAALRYSGFWSSSSLVTTETIALAWLTGIHDLHGANVITRGAAPVLIDADVALQPREIDEGPDKQAGFGAAETGQVKAQIEGDDERNPELDSHILRYAVANPDETAGLIISRIGNHRSRIVPLFTKFLSEKLLSFVSESGRNDGEPERVVNAVVDAIPEGASGSKGLQGEIGDDRGDEWKPDVVNGWIKSDFNKGVIPHFQYQASTGEAFLHGRVIWQGTTLEEAMEKLKARLGDAA